MAAPNSPSVGSSHPVFLFFQTRLSSDIDPNLVAIEVSLKFDQRILGESSVSFPFCCHYNGLFLANYLGDIFHQWMQALSPSLCDRLSEDIVQYAHRVGVANGGGVVVTASMEVEEEEGPQLVGGGGFFGLQDDDDEVEDAEIWDPDFLPAGDVSSSKPRGLSRDEIERLKEERFENNGGDESVCSVCLEKFLPGGKVSPLPCSHVFHHGCITSWLEKSASCPVCRFDVTTHLATT